MSNFREIYPGLEVAREFVRDEAIALAEQLNALPNDFWPILYEDSGFSILRGQKFTVGDLKDPMLSGVSAALDDLSIIPVFEDRENASFNRYQPAEEGEWHKDAKFEFPVFVVALSDIDGYTFEYRESNGELRGIESNAGDILKLVSSSLWHRGNNPSDIYRYSCVLFNVE